MANQIKVGDRIFIPGSGWAVITKLTGRSTWQYTLPGGGVPIAGTGDILAQPEKFIRNTDIGSSLDTNIPSH